MKKVYLFLTIVMVTMNPISQLSLAQIQTETLFPIQCGIAVSLAPTTTYVNWEDFIAVAWTNNSVDATNRSLMQFDFTSIPNNAIIDSAFLSLYWYPSVSNIGLSLIHI